MVTVLVQAVLTMHSPHRAVTPGYRPDWVSVEKPEHNCARIWASAPEIAPDAPTVVLLEPLMPDLWAAVKVGTELRAFEGLRHVGSAKVLQVYRTT